MTMSVVVAVDTNKLPYNYWFGLCGNDSAPESKERRRIYNLFIYFFDTHNIKLNEFLQRSALPGNGRWE
jgi:hypothetical protein